MSQSGLALPVSEAQERSLPDEIDPLVFLDLVTKQLRRFCPSGVEKCECLSGLGTYSEGPFDAEEDLLGTMLTFAACNPGKKFALRFTEQL